VATPLGNQQLLSPNKALRKFYFYILSLLKSFVRSYLEKNLTKTINFFEIMASKKTHFTMANPDPNLAPVVDNPTLISRKSKK